MLKDAFKWMVLTLFVVAALVAGVVLVTAGIRRATEPPAPTATPTATPVATPTNTPLPTVTPTPTNIPPVTAMDPTPTPAEGAVEAFVRETMAGMTLQEKLGQLAMFGFSGTSSIPAGFSDNLKRYQIGNIVLYGANVASGNADGGFAACERLVQKIVAANPVSIPQLISIDVEGGTVVRFRWSPWPSSMRTLGRRNDPDKAYTQFFNIGARLRSIGINMDLAPVLDVSENPMATPLKTRVISSDTGIASSIGSAVIRGLSDAGCLSVAKHFPGLGATSVDSHNSTPVIDRGLETLLSYDLIPFVAAIDADVDAILVGHIDNPSLDSTDIASVSRVVIGDLLRTSLGFTGLVVSDDFRMTGLTSRYSVGDAAVKFILAGGDLILCGPQYARQAEIMQALEQAVADGRITEARIDESVARILLKKVEVCGLMDAER